MYTVYTGIWLVFPDHATSGDLTAMNGIRFFCDGNYNTTLPQMLDLNGPFGDLLGKEEQYCPQGFTGAIASIQGPQVSLIIITIEFKQDSIFRQQKKILDSICHSNSRLKLQKIINHMTKR